MKKVVTYVVMLTYLTMALRPAHAQQQLYDGGLAEVPAMAQSGEQSDESDSYMAEPQQQYQQPAPVPQSGGKPKIAVYVSEHSGYSNEEKSALRSATLNTIVRSGRYQVVERSDVIAAELTKQASGAVDDDQLTAFGRQSGAQYVCVADMTFLRDRRVPKYCSNNQGQRYQCGSDLFRDHQVSVRMIDVETAEVLGFGLVEQDIQSAVAMTSAITAAVDRMLATVQTAKAANMPKMAVYVVGGSEGGRRGRSLGNAGNALYSYTLLSLFDRSRKLGNFKVIERAEAFTLQIDREQITQRSGHVDDGQIARLGKQYGIERILIVAMEYAQNQYVVSGRVINVETASVEKASSIKHTNRELVGLGPIAIGIVEEMMGLTGAEQQQRADRQERKEAAEAKAARNTIIGGIIGAVVLVGLLIWLGAEDKKSNETTSVR